MQIPRQGKHKYAIMLLALLISHDADPSSAGQWDALNANIQVSDKENECIRCWVIKRWQTIKTVNHCFTAVASSSRLRPPACEIITCFSLFLSIFSLLSTFFSSPDLLCNKHALFCHYDVENNSMQTDSALCLDRPDRNVS